MLDQAGLNRIEMNIAHLLHKSVFSGYPKRIRMMFVNRVLMVIFTLLNSELCERGLVRILSQMVDHPLGRDAVHKAKNVFYGALAVREQMRMIRHYHISEDHY